MSPRGRRPGGEDTRAAILEAARAEFAASGYDGASLRGIARAAGVDARLVHHYFDGKSALFAAVMQAPVDPAAMVARVAGLVESPGELGRAVVAMFLSVWDDEENTEALRAMIRSALVSDERMGMMREYIAVDLVGRIVAAHPHTASLPPAEQRFRAGLIASQMVGLAVARYVIRWEGLADAPAAEVAERIGAVVQTHLDRP